MPSTPEKRCEAHINFPSELWHDFIVYSRVRGTTASKLIRNSVRRMLGKPESEMEKVT